MDEKVENKNLTPPQKPEPESTPAENPNLIAKAESEAPAVVNPAFPTDSPTKKSKAPLIAALASLLIVALGVGGYFVFFNQPENTNPSANANNESNSSEDVSDKGSSSNAINGSETSSSQDDQSEAPNKDSSNSTINDSETPTSATELKETPIGILNCRVLNSEIDYCIIPNEQVLNAEEGYLYSLTEFTETITKNKYTTEAANIIVNEANRKEVSVTFRDTSLTTYHNIAPDSSFTLSLPENIIKLKIVGFGHAPGNECIFFITESGNLWYIKYSDFANAAPTPQQLIEISDVIAIYDGGANHNGGWNDAYAVRSDKKVYRINQYITFKRVTE